MKIINTTSELVCNKLLNKIYDEVYFEQPYGPLASVQTKTKDIVWMGIYDIMGRNAHLLIINSIKL